MMPVIFGLLIICIVLLLLFKLIVGETHFSGDKWFLPQKPFPKAWRNILLQKVLFYNGLNKKEKEKFEQQIQEFLLNCKVTGINTEVKPIDKVLIAASAIIPVFHLSHWRYTNLKEVLLYPRHFNGDFETEGKDRNILGMVGNGFMEGTMILSKTALHKGFDNETDKKNTAIHEFVHLIDKLDGSVDGVPKLLLEKQYTIPWLDLIHQKIEEIYEGKSDINPYGGTNKAEFFAVTSEYFFERPKLLKAKHPKLFSVLEEIYDKDMSKFQFKKQRKKTGRNAPCPCGSGEKYKKCCGV